MSSSGIAFTLPISCQICLGKVKQPVVCPNQHVFCSPCMDVWLQRSQHCPACRTPVNEQNPCKQILGGLSQETDLKEDFSKNKELRRARADVLFKEYEEEFDRFENETQTLKHENKVLAEQLKQFRSSQTSDSVEAPSKDDHPDVETLLNLTKKLQETMSSHDKLKKERDRIKKENNYIKDENVNLGRENQQLRMELTSRSPRKYGRFAAAAMETNLESYEKENKLLQKALERSDLYVEEVERELEKHRKFVKLYSKCPNCNTELRVNDDNNIGNQMESETSDVSGKPKGTLHRAATWPNAQSVDESDQRKAVISGTSFYGKKLTPVKSKSMNSPVRTVQRRLDLKKGAGSSVTPKKHEDSFGLEQPSPVTPSTVLRRLAINDTGMTDSSGLESSMNPGDAASSSTLENAEFNMPSTSDNSLTESCRKKLRFDAGKDDIFSRPSTSGFLSDSQNSTLQSSLNADDSLISSKPKLEIKSRRPQRENTFEIPSSTSESDDFDDGDHNMTNDIAECLELLDAAEKKVSQQKFKTPLPPEPLPSSSANLRSHIQHDSKWRIPNSTVITSSSNNRLQAGYDQSMQPPSNTITSSNVFPYSSNGLVSARSSQLPSWYTEIESSSALGMDSGFSSAYKSSVSGHTSSSAVGIANRMPTSVSSFAKPGVSSTNDYRNMTHSASCQQKIQDSTSRQNSHISTESSVRPGMQTGLAPTVSQSSTSSAFASRDNNTLNMHGYKVVQPAYTLSQPSNTLSQPGYILSQPEYILSQPVYTLSQPVSTSSNGFSGQFIAK